MKALIVEDNPDITQRLDQALRERGHDVTACADAESAWDTCQTTDFPLILLDWFLPGMDGLELCRRLRARPGGDQCAILLISGFAQPEDVEMILAAGATDYLAKPFTGDQLAIRLAIAERHVAEICKRRQTRQKLRDTETRFRSLVQHASDIITILDAHGTVRYESPAVERILGYHPDELIGHKFGIIHPEDAPSFAVLFNDLIDQPDATVTTEFRACHRDGSERCVEATFTNLLHDPSISGIVVNTCDITERKHVEDALRDSERRYRDLFAAERRQAQEAALLDRVRTALAGELDLPLLFRTVVDAITSTFGYTQVNLYLIEDDALILQHQVGYDREVPRIPISEGISGRVVRTGAPVLLEDARADPDFIVAIDDVTSEICVPLRDGDQVVGVLNVESVGGITLGKADLRLMIALSEHINVAIGRARLYSEARASEQRYRSVIDSLQEVIFQMDEQGTFTFLNPVWTELTGFSLDDTIGRDVYEFVHPDDRDWLRDAFRPLVHGQTPDRRTEVRCLTKDGSIRWLEVVARLWLDADGTMLGITGTLADITDRRRVQEALRESDERFRGAFTAAPIGMVLVGVDFRILQVNQALCHMLGYQEHELLATTTEAITHPEDRQLNLDLRARLLAGEIPSYQVEKRYLRKDGQPVQANVSLSVVHDSLGRPHYLVGQIEDITERKQWEERLRHQALHDALTGLPNRTLFLDRLEHVLARRDRLHKNIAVMYLDLDGFKLVNDQLGHEAGDQLLIAVSQRLTASLRAEDTLARFGGDEFTILIEDVNGADEAVPVAKRLIAALRPPIRVGDRDLEIGACVGLSLGSPQRSSPDDLLREADAALYRAKAAGRNCYVVSHPQAELKPLALVAGL